MTALTHLSPITQITRSLPWVLGRLMPDTAARWLERRMATPDRPFVLVEADPVFAAGRVRRIPYGDGWLAAREWGAGPTVLLLHGWSGYAAQLKGFVDPLVTAGYRVVAFDAPAHGESDGKTTNLVDYAAAILAVAGAVGPVHGLVAHSFAAPAAAMAADAGLEVPRMVLIAPPRRIDRYARGLRQSIGLPAPIDRRVRARSERRLGRSWDDLDLGHLIARSPARVLVIHDGDDRHVPWRDGQAIAAAAPHGRLKTTAGLGHRRILDDPQVIADAVAFLD